MCDCFLFFSSSKSKPNRQNDPQKPLLIISNNDYASAGDDGDGLRNPTAAMALVLTSWLDGRRFRYLILVLCSPLLVPVLCAAFPVICAAEVCFRLCRRRRRGKSAPPPAPVKREGDVEDGREADLLERYLEDQLGLALEYVNEVAEGNRGDPKKESKKEPMSFQI